MDKKPIALIYEFKDGTCDYCRKPSVVTTIAFEDGRELALCRSDYWKMLRLRMAAPETSPPSQPRPGGPSINRPPIAPRPGGPPPTQESPQSPPPSAISS